MLWSSPWHCYLQAETFPTEAAGKVLWGLEIREASARHFVLAAHGFTKQDTGISSKHDTQYIQIIKKKKIIMSCLCVFLFCDHLRKNYEEVQECFYVLLTIYLREWNCKMFETGFSVNTLELVQKKTFQNKQPPTVITAAQTYLDIQISKPKWSGFLFVWKVGFCYHDIGCIYSEMKAICTQTCTTIIKLISWSPV